ncbi:MAG: insulinase family protein [Lentisphaeria bacterium]|nr:insulinase family protein [Lentisphaeria bacterium]
MKKILLLGMMMMSIVSCIGDKIVSRKSALAVGESNHGFIVESSTDVPEENGCLWKLRHKKNGAEVLWLERDDEIKTFCIIFKTIAQDDMGVAHIQEHAVLSGSEKYPSKSPMMDMMKRSLQVFMNGITESDMTYYPFATRYDEDYMNLMSVYLDSVFCPLSLKNPIAFLREGWHYEFGEDGKLRVNGIVYNEMKGSTANAFRTIYSSMLKTLLPDTPYAFESGGMPDAIPNLSYDDYCAFNAKFYHPSNARVFLDGSVNIDATLAKLDEYYSKYDRLKEIPQIPPQVPVEKSAHFQYESANTERKTAAVEAWCAADYTDIKAKYTLDVIGNYLCGTNESPLARALIDRGLCENVSSGSASFMYVPFMINCENTSDEDAEECFRIIHEELEKVASEGFDRVRLEALINDSEFREREQNRPLPRGIFNLLLVQSQWLYDGDPAAALDLTGIYKALREGLDNGYFEKYLREHILDNHHHVRVVVSPSATLGKEKREAEEARCAAIQAKLTPEEQKRIKEDCEALVRYQRTPDAPEVAAKLPLRELSSVPQEGKLVDSEIVVKDGVTFIVTKPTCDGVSYLNLYFPVNAFNERELSALPLLSAAYGNLGTRKQSALELRTALDTDVGRLSADVVASVNGNYFHVCIGALTDKFPQALSLLEDVLMNTDFSDAEALEKLRKQSLMAFERSGVSAGQRFALMRSGSALNRSNLSREIVSGITHLHFLRGIVVDDKFSKECSDLSKRIFHRNGMVVSYTRNLSDDVVTRGLEFLSPRDDDAMSVPAALLPESENPDGYVISGDSGFAAMTMALPVGVAFHGSMTVAARILSLDFLHRELRQIGGAYGAGFSVSSDGIVQMFSYRDPTPARSYDVFAKCAQALRDFVKEGKSLTPFILGSISSLEPVRTPVQEAALAPELYLSKRTPEDLARQRREILATTPEQLLDFADLLEKAASNAGKCIIGGRKTLESLDGNFKDF